MLIGPLNRCNFVPQASRKFSEVDRQKRSARRCGSEADRRLGAAVKQKGESLRE